MSACHQTSAMTAGDDGDDGQQWSGNNAGTSTDRGEAAMTTGPQGPKDAELGQGWSETVT
jgi:hypothetical protein